MKSTGIFKRIISLIFCTALLFTGYTFPGFSISAAANGPVVYQSQTSSVGPGAEDLPDDKWEYILDGNYATIVKYVGNDTAVNVPFTVDGYYVQTVSNKTNEGIVTDPEDPDYKNAGFGNCTVFNNGPSVETIEEGVFENCTLLRSVNLGGAVKSIKAYAFSGCTGIRELEIPDTTESIGTAAFSGCSGLESLKFYKIYYSVLTEIGDSAFAGCTGLEEISIPVNVEIIGESSFLGCSSVEEIRIKSTKITDIGNNAFDDCTSVSRVYFSGTQAQWENINIGQGNDCITSAEIIYNADTIFTSGDWQYHLYDNSTAILSGYTGSSSDIILPSELDGYTVSIIDSRFSCNSIIVSVTIPDSITKIDDGAFHLCSNLANIDIPDSVTYIGMSAFYECRKLENIDIPDSVTYIGSSAFDFCSNLANIDIPDSVTFIGGGAFSRCSGLQTITLPAGVTLGDNMFIGCSALETIYYKGTEQQWTAGTQGKYLCIPSTTQIIFLGQTVVNGTVTIGNMTFTEHDNSCTLTSCNTLASGKIIIPSFVAFNGDLLPVTSIGERAFYNCNNVTNIILSGNIRSIGIYAFDACYALTYNEFDNGLYLGSNNNDYMVLIKAKNTSITSCEIHSETTVICSNAFYGCNDLTSIIIPDSVKTIGHGAFGDCRSLAEVSMGSGVTLIDTGAFSGCPITSITIPDGVTKINHSVFYGCGLINVTIPYGVTEICDYAFAECRDLTSIIIPETVTSIGEGSFESCGFTSFTIPDTITNMGNCAFSFCVNLTEATIGCGLTSIGYKAFYYCNNLEKVTIPESIISIGDSAFENCVNLSNITIHGIIPSIGQDAFPSYITEIHIDDIAVWADGSAKEGLHICKEFSLYIGDTLVTELIIPNGVTSIGNNAFCGCISITGVTLAESVTSIGKNAFRGCNNLERLTILGNITSIGESAFENCSKLTSVTINGNIQTINQSAFNLCGINEIHLSDVLCWTDGSVKEGLKVGNEYSLYIGDTLVTELVIPNGAVSIGNNTFSGCINLTKVTIPGSVKSIGDYAFSGCQNLSRVTMQNGVTSIGQYAFNNCGNLTKVTMSNDLISIGKYAFYGSAITSVTIPSSVISIGEYAFLNCRTIKSVLITDIDKWFDIDFENQFSNPLLYGNKLYLDGDEVVALIVPNSVTAIHNYAFIGCETITNITIPESVTSIGNKAFYHCNNLAELAISGSVISIGNNAFDECYNLTDITIPDSVVSIGNYAFNNCYQLESVEFGYGVVSIGEAAFKNCFRIKSITLPDNVSAIGENAFDGCYGIEQITIGYSVEEIGQQAFDGCNALTDVYYNGTVDEWEEIDINPVGNNSLKNAVRHYVADLAVTSDFGHVSIEPSGALYTGDPVILSVDNNYVNYNFLGWYNGNERVCTTPVYQFVITADTVLTAKFEPITTPVTVTVNTENGAAYTLTNNSREGDDILLGDSITLTADDADKVLQWQNASGKVLGCAGSLTLTVGGNTEVTLVYKVEGTDNAFVQFISAFGQILSAGLYSSDDVITIPAGPSRLGYTFTCWTIENTDTEATDANIKALFGTNRTITVKSSYTAQDTKYTVTVAYEGVTKDSDVYPDIKIGSGYSVTAPDIDGYVFSCWKNAGNTVSYKKDYYIQVAGDVTLTAVYGTDATEALPVISISAISKIDADGVHKMTASATRSIPDGYTLIEHGILFARDVAGLDENTFVYGTPGVNKHVFASSNKDGVAKLNVKVDDDSVVVSMRGYMVLEKNGVQTVYYTDIVSGSYGA